MAGEQPAALEPAPLAGLRLGIAQGMPFEGIDETVAAAWLRRVGRLGKAGVRLTDETIALFDDMVQVNAKGGFAPPEAYAIHRERLKRRGGDVDPNVRARIERGGTCRPPTTSRWRRSARAWCRAMDAPAGRPRRADPADDADRRAEDRRGRDARDLRPKNMLLLRNTSMVNFFDLCAISLPLPRDGGLPAGLMLVARNGQDRRLFSIAAAVERLFATD